MALFERGGHKHSPCVGDERGSVYVTIRLVGTGKDAPKGQAIKGNITRSFTVSEAKVSEVNEAVLDFLFGDDNDE
jgi:hypothetical protein